MYYSCRYRIHLLFYVPWSPYTFFLMVWEFWQELVGISFSYLKVKNQVCGVYLWILFLWAVLRETQSSLSLLGCESHRNGRVPASVEYHTALQNEWSETVTAQSGALPCKIFPTTTCLIVVTRVMWAGSSSQGLYKEFITSGSIECPCIQLWLWMIFI